MGHVVCSPPCAVEWAARKAKRDLAKLAKAERARDRATREKLKTRSDWMREAQREFNAFIRARDAGKPCICCGEAMNWNVNQVDAGHYRSVGSAPHLRFDERNVHAQSKQCNRWGAGRAVDYRLGLIARIGIEAVESLESDQSAQKWPIDELKEIKAVYRQRRKELVAS